MVIASLEKRNLANQQLEPPKQLFWQTTMENHHGSTSKVYGFCSTKAKVGSICADTINLLGFVHATHSLNQPTNQPKH
jgi:hypothetical protein